MNQYLMFLLLAFSFMCKLNASPLLMKDLPPENIFSEIEFREQISDLSFSELNKRVELTNLQKDYLLYNKINEIDVDTLLAENVTELQSFINIKPQAYGKHPEGPIAIAYFDVASLVKSKLYQHKIHKSYLQLLKSYNKGGEQVLQEAIMSNEKLAIEAYKKLFQNIAFDSLLQLSDLLLEEQQPSKAIIPLLIIAANRTEFPRYYQYVLRHSSSPEANRLLSKVPKVFVAKEAAELLIDIADNNLNLASHALVLLGKLTPDDAGLEYLLLRLKDPKVGSSAAYALSHQLNRSDTALYDFLSHLIQSKSSSRTLVANAILCIKLGEKVLTKNQQEELLSNIRYRDIKQEALTWLQ